MVEGLRVLGLVAPCMAKRYSSAQAGGSLPPGWEQATDPNSGKPHSRRVCV